MDGVVWRGVERERMCGVAAGGVSGKRVCMSSVTGRAGPLSAPLARIHPLLAHPPPSQVGHTVDGMWGVCGEGGDASPSFPCLPLLQAAFPPLPPPPLLPFHKLKTINV